MKGFAALCCTAVLLAFATPAPAGDLSSACQVKRRNIQAQLANAIEQSRTQEVAALKKALRANEVNCEEDPPAKERPQAQTVVSIKERVTRGGSSPR